MYVTFESEIIYSQTVLIIYKEKYIHDPLTLNLADLLVSISKNIIHFDTDWWLFNLIPLLLIYLFKIIFSMENFNLCIGQFETEFFFTKLYKKKRNKSKLTCDNISFEKAHFYCYLDPFNYAKQRKCIPLVHIIYDIYVYNIFEDWLNGSNGIGVYFLSFYHLTSSFL